MGKLIPFSEATITALLFGIVFEEHSSVDRLAS